MHVELVHVGYAEVDKVLSFLQRRRDAPIVVRPLPVVVHGKRDCHAVETDPPEQQRRLRPHTKGRDEIMQKTGVGGTGKPERSQ
jgi:hypothetical protein